MKKNLTEQEKLTLNDKMFITEIINELARRGEVRSGEMSKADTMLKDWSRELRNKCRMIFPASKLHHHFNEIVGSNNW